MSSVVVRRGVESDKATLEWRCDEGQLPFLATDVTLLIFTRRAGARQLQQLRFSSIDQHSCSTLYCQVGQSIF